MAVVLVGVTAFAAGALIRPPDETALRNAQASIDVWGRAQERVVYEGFSLPAVVGAAAAVDIVVTEASPYGTTPATSVDTGGDATSDSSAPPTPPEADGSATTESSPVDRVVVSATRVSSGASLAYGQALAEVSGRPVFAWPSTSPLYRDLVGGASGTDVRGVQKVLKQLGYLATRPDGVFGPQTLRALTELYARAGYELPVIRGALRGLSWREFSAIPALPATVISAAPLGSVLTADSPLLSVRSRTPTLSATASMREVDELQPGAEIAVVVGEKPAVKSVVATLGEFQTDEKTNISGYPLTIVYPAELESLAPGTPVVLRRWNETPPSLAVPITAMRQDASGTYVLARAEKPDGQRDPVRVRVQVIAQSGGWVALAPDSALTPGTDVLVSGTGKR